MYRKKLSRALPIAVALVTLAACGGDGDDNLGDNVPPPGMNPPPPVAPGDTVAITNDSGTFSVVTFNRATPTALITTNAISSLVAGDVIVGADIRPFDGTFNALTRAADGSGKVYTFTTAGALVGAPVPLLSAGATAGTTIPTILNGTTFGVDFNPVPDRLRITSNTGQNLRINLTAAAGAVNTIVDGNLVLNTGGTPGVVEVGYRRSFATTCDTTLYYIDTTTDRLLITSDPNVGTVRAVGAGLGVGDVTAVGGFEIATAVSGATTTDTALALLTVGGTTALYTIDLVAGTATISSAGSFPNNPTFVGLGIAPPATAPTTQPRGNVVAVTENNALISFNSGGSPLKLCTQPVTITGLQTGENVLDIDVRPANGLLYGVTDQSRIYVIDPNTAAATAPITLTAAGQAASTGGQALIAAGTPVVIDPVAIATGGVGIDFNPVPDRLRIVTDTGQNLRVNVGAATNNTLVDDILSTAANAPGKVNDVDVTAVAYTNAFAAGITGAANRGPATTRLFGIDVQGNNLVLQNPPNDGVITTPIPATTVPLFAPGGSDPVKAVGFDINGLNNQAFAGLNLAGGAATGFYTVTIPRPSDTPPGGTPPTITAAATLVGNIAGNARVRGFALVNAASQASQSVILAVTQGIPGTVVTFDAATPGTLITNNAITGLQAGEFIVGIDQRPSNGLVYATTNQSRLFTLVAGGAATLVGTLAPDPADTTAPFSALQGVLTFGTDVNPTPDRLRIVSESLENLRVNMANALVTTDTALIRQAGDANAAAGAPVVSAVAYSNNFANASATALFGIDQTTNTLQRFVQTAAGVTPVINPNNGVLSTVGALTGGPFTEVAAFDIVGGDNTFAIAALQVAAETQSRLFFIDLATGTATAQPAVNVIGPGGTPLITAATVLLTQITPNPIP